MTLSPTSCLTLSLALALSFSVAATSRAAIEPLTQAPAQPQAEPAAPAIGAPQQQPQQPPQNQNVAAAPAPHLLLQGIPGVQQCAAPDWIKPGVRLAFLAASATIQSNTNDPWLVPDPNGPIIDEHGKRWKETDYMAGSASGAGYTMVDVVAVEPGFVVMQVNTYLITGGLQGPAVLTGTSGLWCHPSGCDYFVHPRMLSQLKSTDAQASVSIIRHTLDLNNQHFDALRFTVTGNGRTTSVYDLTSGALLSQNASVVAPGGQVHKGEYIVQTTGNVLAITRFIAARDLNLPWRNSQMPPWVRTMKRARYTGATVTKSPPNLGVADYRVGLTIDLETTYVGDTFSVYKLISTQQQVSDFPSNGPGVSVAVCGPGSVGGIWMDPNALKQLQTGQVLDRDQTLRSQTVVEFAGQGQNGRPTVAIATTSTAGKITNVYDASDGRLLSMTRADAPGESGFSTTIELQWAGME